MSSTKAPKTMSSRLMTMKFMQRAAASPTSSTPNTPDATPSSKRRKVSEASPYTYTPTRTESLILKEALDAEDAKRQDALDRAMVGGRETKWELSCLPQVPRKDGALNVRVVSRAELERDEEEETNESDVAVEKPVVVSGRMTFGRAPTPEAEEKDEDEDEEGAESGSDSHSNPNSGDSDDHEDEEQEEQAKPQGPYLPISNPRPTPTHASAVQANRKARNKKKRDLNKMINDQDSTPVKRKGISAVSAAGNGKARLSGGGGGGGFSGTCFACGKQGHAKRDCPTKNGRS